MINTVKKVLDSIEFYILAGVFFVVIWFFVLSPRKIDGRSMVPYFANEDYILMYKLEYLTGKPQRGDIVVFKHSATQDYIKRVIALPGETITVQNSKVYINGKLLDESKYLADTVQTLPGATVLEGIPYTVPENQYFLMGDNRTQSTDCRDFGAVDKGSIEGRAVAVWFPPQDGKFISRITY